MRIVKGIYASRVFGIRDGSQRLQNQYPSELDVLATTTRAAARGVDGSWGSVIVPKTFDPHSLSLSLSVKYDEE